VTIIHTGASYDVFVHARDHIRELVRALRPADAREERDRAEVIRWVDSGAPLYRIRPPDEPPMHLVSYVVPVDPDRGELLLVAHRKAGLWLPPGGHVEPGEDPWHTVVREAVEELRLTAGDPTPPAFVTVTRTVGRGIHTDVSLWYLVETAAEAVTWFDESEFDAIAWLSPEQILARPSGELDPELPRFVSKLRLGIA
jgi:8-oxo-dGTP pyrophosphatase MutT (NUDIX family)